MLDAGEVGIVVGVAAAPAAALPRPPVARHAVAERIADIHPGCTVRRVEEFVSPDNWPALLPAPVDVVIDACDQGRAKLALMGWSRATGTPLVVSGAAGGKRRAQAVEVGDLSEVTHDPLLASLRQRLRREGAPRDGRIGVRCVFSRESVRARQQEGFQRSDGSLNCHGYGSSVTVTATFGMVAAGEALRLGARLPE